MWGDDERFQTGHWRDSSSPEPLTNGCLSASAMSTCSPKQTLKRTLTGHRQHMSTPIWKKCLHSLPDSASQQLSTHLPLLTHSENTMPTSTPQQELRKGLRIYELRVRNCIVLGYSLRLAQACPTMHCICLLHNAKVKNEARRCHEFLGLSLKTARAFAANSLCH